MSPPCNGAVSGVMLSSVGVLRRDPVTTITSCSAGSASCANAGLAKADKLAPARSAKTSFEDIWVSHIIHCRRAAGTGSAPKGQAKRARFQAKELNVSWRAARPERRALWFANQSGFVANENLLMCIDRGGCKRGRLRHQCAVNECAKRAVPVRRRITRKFFSQKFCQALSRCP